MLKNIKFDVVICCNNKTSKVQACKKYTENINNLFSNLRFN